METVNNLSEISDYITPTRDTGLSYYTITRQYPSGDAEVCALKLGSDDQIRRGGGAARKNTDKDAMDPLTLQKSIRRAKVAVKRKCLTFCPDRMLTLTFRANVTDIDEAWGVLKYFCKLMRGKYENFTYVAVPERQKRGAWHFHLAVRGHLSVRAVRVMWRRAAGKRQGNIDITSPRKHGKNSWNPRHIANYISKYLTKTDSANFNRRRYSSGGVIPVPAPVTGWMAASLGLGPAYILGQLMGKLSDLPVSSFFESDESFFPIIYLST